MPINGNTALPLNEVQKRAKCTSVNRIEYLLKLHLISQGWSVKVSRRFNFSFDIEAARDREHWIVEVNSAGNTGLTESFVAALGELLQRMDIDDPNRKYSVAFPNNMPFRRLWERLPDLVKRKVGITALFVEETVKLLRSSDYWPDAIIISMNYIGSNTFFICIYLDQI